MCARLWGAHVGVNKSRSEKRENESIPQRLAKQLQHNTQYITAIKIKNSQPHLHFSYH